jgi:hypothetical protein
MSDLTTKLELLMKDLNEDIQICKVCKNKCNPSLNYRGKDGATLCCHECRVAHDNMDKPKLLIE